jgi:diguanylate cyclase (GGDEF)-like protein/PAS domain S-box-containing protein
MVMVERNIDFESTINKKQSKNLNKVLYNISKAANSDISLQKLYDIIYQEINTVIDATNFHIALLNKKKGFFAYFIDEKDELDKGVNQFDVSGTLANYNIKYGKSLLVNYKDIVELANRGLVNIKKLGTLTRETRWLGVPLKIGNNTIGSMAVVHYYNPNIYSEKDIHLMEFVSEQIATVIERKKFEESLRQSRLVFSHLFQYNPEALVYVDPKGTILDVNLRFTEVFGFTKEEVLGKNIDQGFIQPDNINGYGKEMTMKAAKDPVKFESVRKKKDGTQFPVLISASPLQIDKNTKRIVCLYQDISEQKKIEENIRNNEEKFASLFRSNPLAAIYHDKKGYILDINTRFTELFGFTLNEVQGKYIDEINFYPPKKIDEGKILTKEAQYSSLKKYETVRKRKDGTEVPVHISTSQVKINDEVQGVIALYQDITEQKQNERLNQVLYHISRAANSQVGLSELYAIIHNELNKVIDAKNFYIAILNEEQDQLDFVYYSDEKETNFSSEKLTYRNTLTGFLIEQGQSLLLYYHNICDLVNEGKVKKPGEMTEQMCWLSVPLKIEEKVIGAMTVQNYYDPVSYSEKDIKLMEIVADQVATAIVRKQSEERITYISFHDSLTGLYNRAYFEEELKRMNTPRYYPLNVIMIDVNGLKAVNDAFGHQQGDQLLKNLAQLLQTTSRKGDILARLGGDEFAIILPNTSLSDTETFCQRLSTACLQNSFKPAYLNPNISMGYASQDGSLSSSEELLREADEKMYQNKIFNTKSREKHLLNAFLAILSERDPHTENHAHRMAAIAVIMGKKIHLNNYDLNRLRLLALLHDIGKIGIPEKILFKPDSLTPGEWGKMKDHSQIGYRIAKNIPDFSSICKEILYHHEKWDGSGYPVGLQGEEIPLLSRIISIIDAYDTMQSKRPYKKAMINEEALGEIKRNSGSQFDPNLVPIFLSIVTENNY